MTVPIWLIPILLAARLVGRALACLTYEVTARRIERLHEITEADAMAEGVTPAPFTKAGREAGALHVEAFEGLWESIHGAGSWALDPWLWVIEFRQVTR